MVTEQSRSGVSVVCDDRQFENIRAILFDKDGTLAHSEPYLRHMAQRRSRLIDAQIPGVGEPLLMAFGVDEQGFNPAGLTAVGSRQENKIAAAAYVAETGRSWLEALEIVAQAFQEADQVMQNKAQETVVLPGVAQVFDRLRQSGLILGVVSSDIRENIEKFLDFYHLREYIEAIQGAEPHLTKPNPQVFWSACDQLGVSPQQTLMVGDSPGDFTMARSAQAAGSIGVAWGWSRSPNLKQADVAIAKLDEIQVIS
ncbi:HAD family hydrolase [Roseofilum sp. BLCC_M91]|uniref:HAD family hydrolase n=1 Tax=Roseofilum halophilum BLCC-M91 TaxID=3022259 RepID=A0ABT7BDN3_9CYAN|nr:HAD family hydrolase [Roseofilum halophilum]MDJ1177297.1 HAD family hydrolase [Roseofilum halophilum BLCC-M91]